MATLKCQMCIKKLMGLHCLVGWGLKRESFVLTRIIWKGFSEEVAFAMVLGWDG